MIKKLKMAIGGALAGLAALFWIMFQHRGAQRDEAKRQRDIARSSAEAVQAANEAAKRVYEASNEQIKHNNEARAKRQAKPASERFTGRVDTGRLRSKSDD